MDEQPEEEFANVATNYADCGEPRIEHGLPFEKYAALKAINSGTVGHGVKSMLRMRAAVEGRLPNEDSIARRFGRGAHSAILTPNDFESDFVISKPCAAKLKSGPRKDMACGAVTKCVDGDGNWYCGTHSGAAEQVEYPAEFISPDELDRIKKIRESLHNHVVNETLRADGWSEVSIVWRWNDLMLKGRIDRFSAGDHPFILDMKTGQSGKLSEEECTKSILEYGWHRQAAMYCHGIKELTGAMPEFGWLFVEKTEPFDVNMIFASPDVIAIGWNEVTSILSAYQNCCKEQKWPGYIAIKENIHQGGLPLWYIKQVSQGL